MGRIRMIWFVQWLCQC